MRYQQNSYGATFLTHPVDIVQKLRVTLSLDCTKKFLYLITEVQVVYTPCPEKKYHFIFDYNSRISSWIL